MNTFNRGIAPLIAIIIIGAVILIGAGATYYYYAINAPKIVVVQQAQPQPKDTLQAQQTQNQPQKQNTISNNQAPQVSNCPLSLQVSGGIFSPQACFFEIIHSGVGCPPTGGCEQYSLVINDKTPGHIREVDLSSLANFTKGTYYFDPATGAKGFTATTIDEKPIQRNLLNGSISLEPLTGNTIKTSFNLLFANNIRISGTGTLPIKETFAP